MKPKKIYLHHSADSDQNPQFWKINDWHEHKWNFKSSTGYYGGYNRLLDRDNRIKIYRADGEETAAQKGDNLESLSLCVAGNYNKETLNETQVKIIRAQLSEWMNLYGIPVENVLLHKKISDTSCPGDNFLFSVNKPLNQKQKLAIYQQLVEWLVKLLKLIRLKK